MSMFGALNRFIARLDADHVPERPSHHAAYGFQVVRSGNVDIPIEPWFDFIVGINGHKIDNADPNLFSKEVRNCAGSSIEVEVWSAKGARSRSVWMPVPADAEPLGLSLQWQPLASTDDVWHVLDVAPNCPADLGGLLPFADYIIGSPEGLLKGEPGLGELVEDFMDRPLRLYVYNHEYNVTRLVTLEPSRTWGGGGALGCMFGYGALHRIPAPLDEPPQGPGETLFDNTAQQQQQLSQDVQGEGASQSTAETHNDPKSGTPQYLIPADLSLGSPGPAVHAGDASTAAAPPPRGSNAASGRKGRANHRATAPGLDMDEFLQEGEAKSKEEDFAPKGKSGAGLPPPPKTGASAAAAGTLAAAATAASSDPPPSDAPEAAADEAKGGDGAAER